MFSKSQSRWWIRILAWAFGVLTILVSAGILLVHWSWFHPTDSYPIVGPAGTKHRAFIADVGGFGLCELLVSASDWPHTFSRPFVLGDIFQADPYGPTGVFWTRDGSVLVLCAKPPGQAPEVFEAAYDFQAHDAFTSCDSRIAALIQARGGLGPRSNVYSEE